MDTFFIIVAKYFIAIPVLLLCAYGLSQPLKRWPSMAYFALPALALAYALGRLGSFLFYDPRPFVVNRVTPLIAHAADNGFPSDHTLLAAAIAAIVTYWNPKLGLVLWALTFLIAAARVYVGVHHAVDVVGSMIIAAVAVSLIYGIFRIIGIRFFEPDAV